MQPAARRVGAEVEGTAMTGVEHLGQYVFEMTQAKMKQVNGNGTVPVMQVVSGDAAEMETEDSTDRHEIETES